MRGTDDLQAEASVCALPHYGCNTAKFSKEHSSETTLPAASTLCDI